MTDDVLLPAVLPDPVQVRDVRLAWVPEGFEPLTSFVGFEKRDDLQKAVNEALESYADKRKEKLLPWIRAGTGVGAAVLNVQGILLLRAAFDEERNR